MSNKDKYDYNKAEADLYDVGARFPEDVFEYKSEKGFRSHLKEHGLNPDKYIKKDNSRKSSSSSSGCYLTTACTVSRGLPDNCEELQTLRGFRDTYLAMLPNGQEEIDRYYHVAPDVVCAINQRENSEEIWNQVYSDLIVPCVHMIHDQNNEAAYRLYKKYSLDLHTKYCS